MSEEQLRQLQRQLWSIADALRGKLNADEFRDYILGFIFYKYLSEKMVAYANKMLVSDNLIYNQLKPSDEHYEAYISAIKNSIVKELGYFLSPTELFQSIAEGSVALRAMPANMGFHLPNNGD